MSKVILKHPVTFGGETYTELTARRLKVKDLKHIPASLYKIKSTGKSALKSVKYEDYIPILAAIFDISEDVMGEIDFEEDFPPMLEAMVTQMGNV